MSSTASNSPSMMTISSTSSNSFRRDSAQMRRLTSNSNLAAEQLTLNWLRLSKWASHSDFWPLISLSHKIQLTHNPTTKTMTMMRKRIQSMPNRSKPILSNHNNNNSNQHPNPISIWMMPSGRSSVARSSSILRRSGPRNSRTMMRTTVTKRERKGKVILLLINRRNNPMILIN